MKRWCAAALVVASTTTVRPALSQSGSGATLVALVSAEPSASLTRHVKAELMALGVDVIVLKPPGESGALRAPLEQAARAVGAIAAVRLIVSGEGKVEVWVADRVTGKAVVRELDALGTSASDEAVAIGTVELLRASLMELHSGEPPRGDVPASPDVRALALAAPSNESPPRVSVGIGGGADLGLRGLGPSPQASVAVWLRLGDRLGLRGLGVASLSPADVTTPTGLVATRSQLFGLVGSYDLAEPNSRWVPTVMLGMAAAHVATAGVAAPPYVGSDAETWLAMPLAGAGIGWAFVHGLRLRGDVLAGWALPAAEIRTATTDVGPWGAPEVLVSLGVEVLWSP